MPGRTLLRANPVNRIAVCLGKISLIDIGLVHKMGNELNTPGSVVRQALKSNVAIIGRIVKVIIRDKTQVDGLELGSMCGQFILDLLTRVLRST